VIDVVWKSPGITSHTIADMVGISQHHAWDRLREAEVNGDIHCRPGWGDSGGWFAGPGRELG
jgi:hypothetical protein